MVMMIINFLNDKTLKYYINFYNKLQINNFLIKNINQCGYV